MEYFTCILMRRTRMRLTQKGPTYSPKASFLQLLFRISQSEAIRSFFTSNAVDGLIPKQEKLFIGIGQR